MMYDSLLLLLLIGAGMWVGSRLPGFLKGYKWLQSGAVAVLLFSMGTAMRRFTDGGSAAGVCGAGVAIGLAAVVGSVLFAHIYRRWIHRGDTL